jgi:carbon storage regulator
MLVISRKKGEEIQIGNDIKITILAIDKSVVKIGIEAPKDVNIKRKELTDTDEHIDSWNSKASV